MNITATPHRQFPLRLHASLADQLDRVSKETQIPKTRIATIGLEKFLAELETTGIRSALRDACEIWNESWQDFTQKTCRTIQTQWNAGSTGQSTRKEFSTVLSKRDW